MATRPHKLAKAPIRRTQQNDEETGAQTAARQALEAMGENGAPDNPTHLMPGVQAGGYAQSIGEPRDDREEKENLTPEQLAAAGYPDPEVTPDEGQISTRNDGTAAEQVEKRVKHTHQMLDDALDSIKDRSETAIRLRSDEEHFSSFSELPNAPKGKDVLILGPDEPLRVSGDEDGGQIVLNKTIYRATRPFRTKRWSFILEYPKGARIPSSQIRKVQEPKPSSVETGTTETKGPEETQQPEEN